MIPMLSRIRSNENKNTLTGKTTLVCGKPGIEMKLADGLNCNLAAYCQYPF